VGGQVPASDSAPAPAKEKRVPKNRRPKNQVAFATQPRVVYVEEDLHSLSWCYQLLMESRTDEDLTIVAASTLVYKGTRLVLEDTLGPPEIARRAKPANAARLWFQPEDYVKPRKALLRAGAALRWSDNFFVRPRGCGATAVVHRFTLAGASGRTIEAEHRVPLKKNRQSTRLRLPFDGWWQMIIGHEHFEHHMRGGGGMGLDFVGLADGGAPHLGSGAELTDWTCYRREVKAPAAGTVTAVHDGSPDSPPNLPRREPVNCVVIDLGADEMLFLAHLVPGSIPVSQGERVARGQVVGLCGSSGYSLAPHVHVGLSRRGVGAPIIFSGYRALRPIEDGPDRFSMVQTVESGVIRHGDIVRHDETCDG